MVSLSGRLDLLLRLQHGFLQLPAAFTEHRVGFVRHGLVPAAAVERGPLLLSLLELALLMLQLQESGVSRRDLLFSVGDRRMLRIEVPVLLRLLDQRLVLQHRLSGEGVHIADPGDRPAGPGFDLLQDRTQGVERHIGSGAVQQGGRPAGAPARGQGRERRRGVGAVRERRIGRHAVFQDARVLPGGEIIEIVILFALEDIDAVLLPVYLEAQAAGGGRVRLRIALGDLLDRDLVLQRVQRGEVDAPEVLAQRGKVAVIGLGNAVEGIGVLAHGRLVGLRELLAELILEILDQLLQPVVGHKGEIVGKLFRLLLAAAAPTPVRIAGDDQGAAVLPAPVFQRDAAHAIVDDSAARIEGIAAKEGLAGVVRLQPDRADVSVVGVVEPEDHAVRIHRGIIRKAQREVVYAVLPEGAVFIHITGEIGESQLFSAVVVSVDEVQLHPFKLIGCHFGRGVDHADREAVGYGLAARGGDVHDVIGLLLVDDPAVPVLHDDLEAVHG